MSALGSVHQINLANCDKITDVSSLGGVHTLNLRYCNITDVSNLGKVHTLNLLGCINITEISMLHLIYHRESLNFTLPIHWFPIIVAYENISNGGNV